MARQQSNNSSKSSNKLSLFKKVGLTIVVLAFLIGVCVEHAMAGGKGGKGEDIIMYKGNIIMRGEKKGGSIVFAPGGGDTDIEFIPMMWGMGGMGGMRRRRSILSR